MQGEPDLRARSLSPGRLIDGLLETYVNPEGSVSVTPPACPYPLSAVIVTTTRPPAATDAGENDLLALGS